MQSWRFDAHGPSASVSCVISASPISALIPGAPPVVNVHYAVCRASSAGSAGGAAPEWKHGFTSLLDPLAPKILLAALTEPTAQVDKRLARALTTVLAKGAVPLPDALLSAPVRLGGSAAVSIESAEVTFLEGGGPTAAAWSARASAERTGAGFDLVLTPLPEEGEGAAEGGGASAFASAAAATSGASSSAAAAPSLRRFQVTGSVTLGGIVSDIGAPASEGHAAAFARVAAAHGAGAGAALGLWVGGAAGDAGSAISVLAPPSAPTGGGGGGGGASAGVGAADSAALTRFYAFLDSGAVVAVEGGSSAPSRSAAADAPASAGADACAVCSPSSASAAGAGEEAESGSSGAASGSPTEDEAASARAPLRCALRLLRAPPAVGACAVRPLREWTSTRSFLSYPTAFEIERCACGGGASSSAAGAGWTARAVAPSQELLTLAALPACYLGRYDVVGSGSASGAACPPVGGVGALLFCGHDRLSGLDAFFKAVGAMTRRAVRAEYPDVLSPAHAVEMIATSPAHAWHTDGVDLRVYQHAVVAPVRHLVDAGGKSWRSFGLLAAADAVGGDSNGLRHFLALAEFLHVGSLIVDDLQDASSLRRGVRAVHLQFGDAVAINAGTAAYFHCQRIIMRGEMPAERRLAVLEHYFGCMRAGHAGQGLDIAGLSYLMDEAIASGDARTAEVRLLAVHALKTGVPAASLVRIGAVLGRGAPAQVEALGLYFESIGKAFQIMDDVLNLRGIYSNAADKAAGVELKNLGEDIAAGKCTFPVVKALTRLPRAQMAALWETIKGKPSDRATIADCIAQLEACGAISACVDHAATLVREGFAHADGALPDSFAKCILQAFGSFLVEHSGG